MKARCKQERSPQTILDNANSNLIFLFDTLQKV